MMVRGAVFLAKTAPLVKPESVFYKFEQLLATLSGCPPS